MLGTKSRTEASENAVTKDPDSFDFRRLVFRVLSYWPYALILLVVAPIFSWIYLRYETPVFSVSTRVVVNDDTQEKNNNLFEAFRLNYSNTDQATEKELEILRSKSLAENVIRKLKLYQEWTTEGRITDKPQFDDLPVSLQILTPDSIKRTVEGIVSIKNRGKIIFNNAEFLTDTFVNSEFGKIRWEIKRSIDSTEIYKLRVTSIDNATKEYKKRIEASPINKYSSIIDISINDPIPARGQLYLNAMLDEYVKGDLDNKRKVSQNTLKFIDERLRLVAVELGSVETELQSFRAKEGVVNLGVEGELFLTQIKELDQREGELDIQLKVLNDIQNLVQQRNLNINAPPATLGLNDPVLTGLLEQLYKTEFEARRVEEMSGIKNPNAMLLRGEIEKLKQSILNSLNNLKISILATKASIRADISRVSARVKNIPQKERALLEISRQQQIKNNIYTFLLQKREESALAAASQVPNIRIIDKPDFVGQISPRPGKVYGIGLFIAVALFAIILYFKEFNNANVMFRDEIEQIGLPVIGELIYDVGNSETFAVGPSKRSVLAEQIRELRTNLSYLPMKNSGCKVLLLTSSIPSEGKSFLAVNLSASLAQAGKSVVLLEFDLRRPRISKALNLSRSPGLSNFLIGQADIDQIIKPLPMQENMHVISSGHIPPNPAELIMNGKLDALISHLKNKFDFILIDSPPVGSVTDGKLLAAYADATLYLVRQNFTPREFLRFVRQVNEDGVLPSLHIVFNGVTTRKIMGYKYSYGYGYGYGYGYSYADEKS